MTGSVVDRLSSSLDPQRPYWSPARRFGLWAVVQGAIAALALGLGPGATARLRDAGLALEVVLLALFGFVSAAIALRAAVPGRHPRRALAIAAGTVCAGVTLVAIPDVTVAAVVPTGSACALKTLLLAAIPWLVLAVALVRGAVLQPLVAGLLAGVGPLAVAAAVMRVVCRDDDGMHLLVWHDLPVVLGVAASVAAGVALFDRWARTRV